MNLQEELVLKILCSVDVIKGKTKFMKILHLVCKMLEKNQTQSPFKFRDDKFGVYSPELQPVLDEMKEANYVNIDKPFFGKRENLSAIYRSYEDYDEEISSMSSKIEALVQSLNQYSSDDIIAISYSLFPETTSKSTIKPIVNKKITELFSPLSTEFEESDVEENLEKSIGSEVKSAYPQFNDLDVRVHMIKSLGLKELPQIIPEKIDESAGFLSKKYSLLKKYDFEKMLEDARRG